MLSASDNRMICEVGPNTPMGGALRQYWLPALQSSELPDRDGDPVHVELAGQNFVAFRDSNGTVGLLDELCCHRGASLTLGRVEHCGIRCIFHGWLFAADGTVLETPNVADDQFKTRFKARSYTVREAGGLIWAYLGDAESMPPFPDFAWVDAPVEHCLVANAIISSNYVQVLEGLLDSSHLGLLHESSMQRLNNSNLPIRAAANTVAVDNAPRIEAELTAFGLWSAAVRNEGPQSDVRVTAFAAPFYIYDSTGVSWYITVPMTDEKTAYYHVWYDGTPRFGDPQVRRDQLEALGLEESSLESFGMTRKTADGPNVPSRANGWKQDRAAMRDGHFSGLFNFTQEDAIINMSSGKIRDRSLERISSADISIARLYMILLKSAKLAAAGQQPVALNVSLGSVKGVRGPIETGADWRPLLQLPEDIAPRMANMRLIDVWCVTHTVGVGCIVSAGAIFQLLPA